ncbi:hypothetical protein MNQ95_01930 [Pseudoxanthomonas daejeonensis]|uniref:hypothetical protein n=1 Tax=Pseudoxanthomonas daejeonensis TaxID=266062 RepID=UPI001F546F39|nr:hypothetical protein [Pseudoxanthomonas daejeonensis]UNK59184.1 hypothetical protein MNQ95_01930 [Pseudoxanthomonas daejeonensis]
MAIDSGTGSGQKDGAGGERRSEQEARQETSEQRQDGALEDHRRQPSASETQVRREQGGHDRPVGGDQKPHPRPQATPQDGKKPDAQSQSDNAGRPDPKAGVDSEVGDLDDPDAEKKGALPGRAGGGLAGG